MGEAPAMADLLVVVVKFLLKNLTSSSCHPEDAELNTI